MGEESQVAIGDEKHKTQVESGSAPKPAYLRRKSEQMIIEERDYEDSSEEKGCWDMDTHWKQ